MIDAIDDASSRIDSLDDTGVTFGSYQYLGSSGSIKNHSIIGPVRQIPGFGGWPPSFRQTNVQCVLCPLHFSAIRFTRFHDLR